MIELTVKTLDSQNHQFSVEDDITVEQFKVKIADTVNIPAETQRIIYCGRVLQDSSKLADYDVHGKVVHLVQRPPPGTAPRTNSRPTSPQSQRRGFRGFRGLEQGNAMYLGSMAFPGNLMESQGIVPPPPTHSLSGSRLNVARRMLGRAEAVIRLLESPNARHQDQPLANENQEEEEEVTPVIEARVIVPSNIEPIDEVLNAVQNTLLNASNNTRNLNSANTSGNSQVNSDTGSIHSSADTTPTGATPRSSSTENLNAEQRPTTNNGLPENASRTVEMSDLLTLLGQLQVRLAPFLERYQTFMRDDPEVPADNQRQTQIMLNRVSEVMHFLGHAYHSLSDLIIRVRTPPPRPLLCRPILIQHSAVVQTGIPIQVEAQINLSADRVNPPTTNAGTTPEDPNTSTTATTAAAAPSTNTTSAATTNSNAMPTNRPTISVQPGFVGVPFLPSAAMRVQSFPVEIRSVRPLIPPRTQSTTSDTTSTAPPTNAPENNTNSSSSAAGNGTTNAQDNPQGAPFNFNNPNVEFFMEVTPEVLRGALNGPTPEFLQSLMQMAGQIINRNIQTTGASAPGSEPAQPASTQSTQSTSAGAQAQPVAGQNSQARGNTQTNPTTSTYTRSTPRPHVHLAQQAMQGGFDPFLPCNSHHISRRGRMQAQQTPIISASASSNQNSAPQQPREDNASGDQRNARQSSNILNFINGIFDSIRSEQRRGNENDPWGSPNVSNNSANGDNTLGGFNLASIGSILNLQGGLNLPDLLSQGPTLDQLLQQFQQDDQYVPGESIIIDLIMLFVRNLTLVDTFSLYSGNVEPINRNISEIQNFFRTRICEGDTSPAGIDRGVEKLIREMQPFLENFRSLPVQNDIDMVRSAEQLFRQRLPNIIIVANNLNTNTTRMLIDQCITTAKQLLALTLLASSTGQRGVEQVYEQIMTNFLRDIPQDIQNWTLMTSRVQFRQILSNLSIPESILQPYIVHKPIQQQTRPQQHPPQPAQQPLQQQSVFSTNPDPLSHDYNEIELMDVDVQDVRTELNASIIVSDNEPLPNVVIGSEPWHGQVPEDWVPIITRDAQKQRRQNPQGPFSDAYLSGMPSKRRKIVNNSKPHGSLPQVISESVRQAVTASGLTSVAPLEVVAQAAGASSEIQNAYRNLLRSTVQTNLKDNEDFHPERYPNVSNYFNSSSQ
ncbi:unnamed protein product [Psylliodes chrysocephalus]|uniref:Large proline-rich protein BAG6 n=1 Tax=Psylliodes chrysocephalus TaxID=3402493 RepID=A0A9P0GAX6_9CUCU|nr:unnamed protein product [Psylliodes chrysocephala]